MDSKLFNKMCIATLQKLLNDNKVVVEDFDSNFSNICIGGINIKKCYGDYCLNLNESMDDAFLKCWNDSMCKFFIKDMRKNALDKYKMVNYENVYYLLRVVDDNKLEEYIDVKYVDNNYSIVAISDNKNFSNVYLPLFNLRDYFNASLHNNYEAMTIIDNNEDEDNDELTSKTLFNEEELSN